MHKLFTMTLLLVVLPSYCYGWHLGDVLSGMRTNVTKPGNYQDSAAGYYSAGGFSMRTQKASFQPFSVTPPNIKMGCSGIDMYMGSFSMISGQELLKMGRAIRAQGASYAFQLALKTFAPQLENLMSKLRDMAMSLNEFSVEDCQLNQSLFASALPKDTAMYETVCKDLERSAGGKDYFKARSSCENHQAARQKAKVAQNQDPTFLVGDYNLLIKAADKAKIPKEMAESIQSLVGTIVSKDGQTLFYESFLEDDETWKAHLYGGDNASKYVCKNDDCTVIDTLKNQSIAIEGSYQGKVDKKVTTLLHKKRSMQAYNQEDIAFLDSVGSSFPLYDYLTFEAISGMQLIDKSTAFIATQMILQHTSKIIHEVKQALHVLEAKQVSTENIERYLNALGKLESKIWKKNQELMKQASYLKRDLERHEQHQLARVRC